MAALRITAILALVSGVLVSAPALAGDAAAAHASWRTCLGQAYLTDAAFTGRDLAADAAIRSCRGEETAYLTALSASPFLDGDDIAQARPDLIARERVQLLGMVNAGPRSVMR